MIPNNLPLPQEINPNTDYSFGLSSWQRVACPLCPGRTIRKHLKVCNKCGRVGCPACVDRKAGCPRCQKGSGNA
jgi:hypothetical protein